jgi:hypothetical protein
MPIMLERDPRVADALQADMLRPEAELTALKFWLSDPVFVARLLRRLVADDPDLRKIADDLLLAVRRANLSD